MSRIVHARVGDTWYELLRRCANLAGKGISTYTTDVLVTHLEKLAHKRPFSVTKGVTPEAKRKPATETLRSVYRPVAGIDRWVEGVKDRLRWMQAEKWQRVHPECRKLVGVGRLGIRWRDAKGDVHLAPWGES